MLHQLISASQPNVLRPATAIVRKLVISSPQVNKVRKRAESKAKDKGKGKEKEGAIDVREPLASPMVQYGFDKIYMRMEGVQVPGDGDDGAFGIFRIVVKRLEGTGDLELVAQR